jgi:hypothetical protein
MGVGTLIYPEFNKIYKDKCCVDGLLPSCSPNFNKDVMVKLDMEQFPAFMRLAIHFPNFHDKCTTFNNTFIII